MHATAETATEPAALRSLIVPPLLQEMAAPRQLGESFHDYCARLAAHEDILADLVDEYVAGGGDPWFETDPGEDRAA